jgi:hypothetical protein
MRIRTLTLALATATATSIMAARAEEAASAAPASGGGDSARWRSLELRVPWGLSDHGDRPEMLSAKTMRAPAELIVDFENYFGGTAGIWVQPRLAVVWDGVGPLFGLRMGLGLRLKSLSPKLRLLLGVGALTQNFGMTDSWRDSPYSWMGYEILVGMRWEAGPLSASLMARNLDMGNADLTNAEDIRTSVGREALASVRAEGSLLLGALRLGGQVETVTLPKTAISSSQFSFVIEEQQVNRAEARVALVSDGTEIGLSYGQVFGVDDAREHAVQAASFLDGHLLSKTYVVGDLKWNF